mmetsp:Transcript_14881/g.40972  ORF Transcript_14881/g.40972 Transcript_14881/m.40972 type:complete len:341 (+) Transcript_14881:489-1511(+)
MPRRFVVSLTHIRIPPPGTLSAAVDANCARLRLPRVHHVLQLFGPVRSINRTATRLDTFALQLSGDAQGFDRGETQLALHHVGDVLKLSLRLRPRQRAQSHSPGSGHGRKCTSCWSPLETLGCQLRLRELDSQTFDVLLHSNRFLLELCDSDLHGHSLSHNKVACAFTVQRSPLLCVPRNFVGGLYPTACIENHLGQGCFRCVRAALCVGDLAFHLFPQDVQPLAPALIQFLQEHLQRLLYSRTSAHGVSKFRLSSHFWACGATRTTLRMARKCVLRTSGGRASGHIRADSEGRTATMCIVQERSRPIAPNAGGAGHIRARRGTGGPHSRASRSYRLHGD